MKKRPGKIEVTMQVTANERLADAYTRHMILLGRLANGESRRVIGVLDSRVFPALLGMTESALTALRDRSPAVFQRKGYANLLKRARATIASGFGDVRADFARELYRICQAEAQFSLKVLGREVPFDFRPALPKFEKFRELVYQTPINGHNLGKRFELLAGNTAARYEAAINDGLRAGETAEQITRRVRGTAAARYQDGVLGRVRQWTETEVKTAVDHVGNGARQAVHEENDDVVKLVVWRAVLDGRTCPACAALDGRQFNAKSATTPPLHARCRCWLDPVLKSAKEMGLKPGDLPPLERQSMTGKVPYGTTFNSYMRKQPRAFQDEVLGPTRAKLWRSGRVKLDRFVDDRNRILNLTDLARREGIEIK